MNIQIVDLPDMCPQIDYNELINKLNNCKDKQGIKITLERKYHQRFRGNVTLVLRRRGLKVKTKTDKSYIYLWKA